MRDLTRRVHIEVTYNPERAEYTIGWSAYTQHPTTYRWEVASRGVSPMVRPSDVERKVEDLTRTMLEELPDYSDGPFSPFA